MGEFGVTKEAPETSRRAWVKAVREEAENELFMGLLGACFWIWYIQSN
ncbi:endoglucanase domain protein [Clostridioides difficile DA00165]|nr:endoglucanase domain protein [Clostridioides difficile DA00165]